MDTAYPGYRLTNHGLTQAASLPGRLADEPIEAVYASPLTRAQQTATPLAESLGLEVQILDGVQEISAGVEELNHDWRAYVAELLTWSSENMDSCLEGGETARQFMSRFTSAISRVESTGHDCAAIVSHGAALRVWTLAQDPGFGLKKAPPLNNTQWIVMNGSCQEGWSIERWGDAVA